MNSYCVIIATGKDQQAVRLAASLDLEWMQQLADLICKHAWPEISWVKIEDDEGEVLFYWSIAGSSEKERALLSELPVSDDIN